MEDFFLGTTRVGKLTQPYVIAEIGVNHEGSFEKAIELIDLAKEGGADAAKFQTYKAGTLASKHSPAYWDLNCEPTTSQYELFQKYDKFGEKEYIALAEHCQKVGIDFLSTPFDDESIDFLDPLMDYYKIASADLTNIPLLNRVSSKKKPIILSTGASTLAEIDIAVNLIRRHDVPSIYLLHCVLNYPTQNYRAHLGMIRGLERAYPDCIIGYSDHTLPCPEMKVLMNSYALGARVIEKHFTHDKTLPGNDHYHAMNAEDLKNFRERVDEYIQIYGLEQKKPIDNETISRINARRSIVAARDLKKDETITEDHITYKRPGSGIPIIHWEEVIGATLRADVPEDNLLSWEDIKLKEG